ncbi:MAG: class I SAM-dependent methyltransferase [Actinobacteria bacterium]|nr:class I SAM-dependent methyltransferase [Actinomycetota bacterium]
MQSTRARDDPNAFARSLFDGLPERYDILADVLSFGQNARWRRAMVDRIVAAEPRLVLDVATGPAGVARQLARRTGGAVVGIDLTEEMLRKGVENVARDGDSSSRVTLLVGRGEQLPFPDGTFDALTFTYLLRYVDDPAATIAELARVVRPGGTIASLEFAVPVNRVWQASWWLYTRALLPAAGALTGGREWFDVGRFLGPSISNHYRDYPVAWTVRAWNAAGIASVGARRMSLGGGLVMWGRKAS